MVYAKRPTETESRGQANLRRKLHHVMDEAHKIAANANMVAQAVAEILENGGKLDIEKQKHFLTGAYARFLQDAGAVAFLQELGQILKKPPQA